MASRNFSETENKNVGFGMLVTNPRISDRSGVSAVSHGSSTWSLPDSSVIVIRSERYEESHVRTVNEPETQRDYSFFGRSYAGIQRRHNDTTYSTAQGSKFDTSHDFVANLPSFDDGNDYNRPLFWDDQPEPGLARSSDDYFHQNELPTMKYTTYTYPHNSLRPPADGRRVTVQKLVDIPPLTKYYAHASIPSLLGTPQTRLLRPAACSTPNGSFVMPIEEEPSFSGRRADVNHYTRLMHTLTKSAVEERKYMKASKAKIENLRYRSKRYTRDELLAHAIYLMSYSRRAQLLDRIARFTTRFKMNLFPPPVHMSLLSTANIKLVEVILTEQFFFDPQCDAGSTYYFLMLANDGARIWSSEILNLTENENLRGQRIRISEGIKFAKLPLVFDIELSMYLIKSPKPYISTFGVLSRAIHRFGGACGGGEKEAVLDSFTDEDTLDVCDFKEVGRAHIARENKGVAELFVSENEFPLEGRIRVYMDVTPLPGILETKKTGIWQLWRTANSYDTYYMTIQSGVLRFRKGPSSNPVLPGFAIDLSEVCNEKFELTLLPFKTGRRSGRKRLSYFMIEVVAFPSTSPICEQVQYRVGVPFMEAHEWLCFLNECLRVIRSGA